MARLVNESGIVTKPYYKMHLGHLLSRGANANFYWIFWFDTSLLYAQKDGSYV